MLARRAQALEAEVAELDAILKPLVAETAPDLIARVGIGTDSAARGASEDPNPRRAIRREIFDVMRSRRSRVVAMLVLMALGETIWLRAASPHHRRPAVPCHATVGQASYPLDLEQAANATTVAAVGKGLGLADHAVTIALAAALQESQLHNLSYGDLDSLGLFQQRPSQGWGTPSDIMFPRRAAAAFFRRLSALPDWQTMAVTDAAQSVQHSAAPNAYAQWEAEARLLAEVLTGEAPAGLTCRFRKPAGSVLEPSLTQAMLQELGPPTTGVLVPAARGWTVASWLVGHARQYRIPAVAFDGRRWTPAQGAWSPDPLAPSRVQITVASGPTPRSAPHLGATSTSGA